TGEYYDEKDLDRLYVNKQDALETVKKNTRKYYCPVRECWMFENPNYKRSVKDKTELGTSSKRMDKPGKKKRGKDPPPQDKLKAGERKRLSKKLETLNAKYLQAAVAKVLPDNCGEVHEDSLDEAIDRVGGAGGRLKSQVEQAASFLARR
ncbi:unnamed protein product, partial [Effrenium voratum]